MTAISDVVRWVRQRNRQRLARRHDRRDAKAFRAQMHRERNRLAALAPAFRQRQHHLQQQPLISVLWLPDGQHSRMPAATLNCLRDQCYGQWEVLSDSPLPVTAARHSERLRHVPVTPPATAEVGTISLRERYNLLLAHAQGQYVIALHGADTLAAPHGLMLMAEAAERFACPPIVYCDEMSEAADGRYHTHQFKCAWNQELQRSTHYLGRGYAVRLDLARAAGGLADLPWREAEQLLVLTASEALPLSPAVHVPHVLYTRSAERGEDVLAVPPGSPELAAAVQAHLTRRGERVQVQPSSTGGLHLRYAVPDRTPLVSLIVPTRNGLKVLRQCVDSVLALTRYPNYELLIVDNGSDDPDTLAYMAAVAKDPRVRVRRDDRPFNFSALNNHALPACRGEFLVLLNNDTEVISPHWLCEMVGLGSRPDVGAVGARLWFSNRTLQHAGVLLGIGGAAGHAHLGLSRDEPGYLGRAHLAQEFSAVTGACMLVKRDVFEAVGGLDEKNLAIDLNDIDLCLKIRSAGLRVMWTPFAELYHHESATRAHPERPDQLARYHAERAYFCKRWKSWLGADPAYNPNLTLAGQMFAVAPEPRLHAERPWFEQWQVQGPAAVPA